MAWRFPSPDATRRFARTRASISRAPQLWRVSVAHAASRLDSRVDPDHAFARKIPSSDPWEATHDRHQATGVLDGVSRHGGGFGRGRFLLHRDCECGAHLAAGGRPGFGTRPRRRSLQPVPPARRVEGRQARTAAVAGRLSPRDPQRMGTVAVARIPARRRATYRHARLWLYADRAAQQSRVAWSRSAKARGADRQPWTLRSFRWSHRFPRQVPE